MTMACHAISSYVFHTRNFSRISLVMVFKYISMFWRSLRRPMGMVFNNYSNWAVRIP